MKFIISQTDEILVSHSGLALAGALLQQTRICKRADAIRLGNRKRPEVSHGEVLTAMIGLLCLGKPDFEAIEAFREDGFFGQSLQMARIPSAATLRQRLDELGQRCDVILREESAAMIARHAPPLTPCYEDWLALDIDVSPFDNSGTKKEGVSWTYKQVDGYAPILAYLAEGYLVHCQLRPGSQHCQEGTPEFLREAIGYARQITPGKLLVRMDAGNDAVENLEVCQQLKVDWIIKRNLRQESVQEWMEEAEAFGECLEPRDGKEVFVGETVRERGGRVYRVVYEVTRRTITAEGQRLLVPEIDVATYWTSLKLPPQTVVELYRQHGTSEQYHSEFKSDLDLERLPSGKLATNGLVLLLGQVAYNVLRLCGQMSLAENERLPPAQRMRLRKRVARRRLRSVIQDLMYLAARWTRHAYRWGLSFWRNNPWQGIWQRLYETFKRRPHPARR